MNIRMLLRKEKIIPNDLFNRIESSGLPLENIGIDVLNLNRRSYNALVISHIDTLDTYSHVMPGLQEAAARERHGEE